VFLRGTARDPRGSNSGGMHQAQSMRKYNCVGEREATAETWFDPKMMMFRCCYRNSDILRNKGVRMRPCPLPALQSLRE
jgi:hypothetical protein